MIRAEIPNCDLTAAATRFSTPASALVMVAVHVLTHETAHLTGLVSEAEAECWAMQHDARTAQGLGATPAQAQALAERYWREVYPRMATAYRSETCAPGGPLDRTPDDDVWP